MRCSHDCCTHFSPNPLPSPPDGNPQTPLAAAPAPAGMVGGKCCCVFATTNVTQTLHLLEVEFQRWALRFHKCPNLRRMKSSACPSVPARTPSSLLAGHPALRDHEPCHCVGWETGPVVRKQRRCKDELTMEICSYRRENTATTQTWLLTDIYHFHSKLVSSVQSRTQFDPLDLQVCLQRWTWFRQLRFKIRYNFPSFFIN